MRRYIIPALLVATLGCGDAKQEYPTNCITPGTAPSQREIRLMQAYRDAGRDITKEGHWTAGELASHFGKPLPPSFDPQARAHIHILEGYCDVQYRVRSDGTVEVQVPTRNADSALELRLNEYYPYE